MKPASAQIHFSDCKQGGSERRKMEEILGVSDDEGEG